MQFSLLQPPKMKNVLIIKSWFNIDYVKIRQVHIHYNIPICIFEITVVYKKRNIA